MAEKDKTIEENRKTWSNFDFGHKRVIRELNIDVSQLPDKIKEKIRGLNLGLMKINDEPGFQKLVTLGAAIGDSIITWHEKEIDKTEEEFNKEQQAMADEQKKEEARQQVEREKNQQSSGNNVGNPNNPALGTKLDPDAQERVNRHIVKDGGKLGRSDGKGTDEDEDVSGFGWY